MSKKLNKYLDHTLLKAEATKAQITQLCNEAKEFDFATVCVNSYWVPFCHEQLKGTDVGITTVIGFPLGAMSSAAKAFEAQQAIKDGVTELDMVMNIGEMLAGNYDLVLKDMQAVRAATKDHVLKVIFENAYLTKEQIIKACELAVKAGIDFVKTSTGFAATGATIEDVKLMKSVVGDRAQVKAAGGVRTKEDTEEMIAAGASRIGTSGGVKIVQGQTHNNGY